VKAPRPLVASAVVLAALVITAAVSAAVTDEPDASGLQIEPASALAAGSPLGTAGKIVNAVVRLSDAPLAVALKQGAMSRDQQQAYVRGLMDKQNALKGRLGGLGAQELGSVTKGLNAIIVRVDAARLKDVAALPGVTSVQPIGDYELDLSNSVPYIGAAALQSAGVDGSGVTVAVLDSGIDYTHADFGGPGTVDAYKAAYGTTTADPKNTTTDGLFPTAKVIGGFDFVGEGWPTTALAADPDPIDCGTSTIPAPCAGGHGSHVADIVAGIGSAKGVAPGAKLLAVKVCSAVATSCSGVALLKAVDFALDPNGDGAIDDRADVMNLSLGSNYGQREDDLSASLQNTVDVGVVVAAAAGNAADRPYIVSSPSIAPGVISVAQTQMPNASAFFLHINSPASIAGDVKNTETVGWAPIGSGFTGDVVFVGRGCPDGSGANVPPGGDPYLANPAGKVALIDRGECSVSLKVDRAAKAGAIGVLIGLVAPGDPVSFSFGGGDTFVPTLIITQATSNLIKANIAAPVNVSVGPAFTTPLIRSMVASSARGPSVSENAIKPDIGAPGASVSAEAGTGTGTTSFGGTSGATPMIAGSAALLLDARSGLSPKEVKSLLMNTAETNIQINPALQPGVLAPITRIGGGEVRVDKAVASKTAVWDADAPAASLSFAYEAVSAAKTYSKQAVIRNYDSVAHTYAVSSAFRYADDAASGAVSIEVPSSVTVAANSSRQISVRLRVDPSKLPVWTLNGGSRGGDGFRLQGVEFDGYITVNGGANNTAHLAWQYLPHRAAEVKSAATSVVLTGGSGTLQLNNTSAALAGRVDSFSLTGSSTRIGTGFLPNPGSNFAVVDLKSVGLRLVGIGGGAFGVQFAVDTWGQRSSPNYPAEFDVYIDSNRDGFTDRIVFNRENGNFGTTGQNVTAVFTCTHAPPNTCDTGSSTVFFFSDADFNSGNMILTAPLSALGVTPDTKFDFSVYAFDNYFTGFLTDAIEGMTYTLGSPRFFGSGIPATGVPAGGSSTLTVDSIPGGDAASPSQTGLLLLYRDAKSTGNPALSEGEADAITVTP
jgi:subtilisin family serine protease